MSEVNVISCPRSANQRLVTEGTADRERDLARSSTACRRRRTEEIEETSRDEKTSKIHLEGGFTPRDFPERYVSLNYINRTDKKAENKYS